MGGSVAHALIVNRTASRSRSTSACLQDMGCTLAVPADGKLTWTYTYVVHDRAPYAELEQERNQASY